MIEKVDVKSFEFKRIRRISFVSGREEIPGKTRYMNGCTSIMSPPLMK